MNNGFFRSKQDYATEVLEGSAGYKLFFEFGMDFLNNSAVIRMAYQKRGEPGNEVVESLMGSRQMKGISRKLPWHFMRMNWWHIKSLGLVVLRPKPLASMSRVELLGCLTNKQVRKWLLPKSK